MAAQNTTALNLTAMDIHCNSVVVGGVNATQGNSATECTIYAGTGAPSFTATQGSLYLRTDGSSTSTRLYINTTGSTTWTNVTTAG